MKEGLTLEWWVPGGHERRRALVHGVISPFICLLNEILNGKFMDENGNHDSNFFFFNFICFNKIFLLWSHFANICSKKISKTVFS